MTRTAAPPTPVDQRATAPTELPPGQRRIDWFPRFGKDLSQPPPPVPPDAAIVVEGAVDASLTVPLAALDELPRQVQRSDFHCVAGWSVTGLQWEGVRFADFYDTVIVPRLQPGVVATHVSFHGADEVWAAIELADACGDDVVLADRLDGRPLDGDHGAPVRLVSPQQYGYVNIKHLCRIGVHTQRPADAGGLGERLLRSHRRARVWHEERRHGLLPRRLVRLAYLPLGRLLLRSVRR